MCNNCIAEPTKGLHKIQFQFDHIAQTPNDNDMSSECVPLENRKIHESIPQSFVMNSFLNFIWMTNGIDQC